MIDEELYEALEDLDDTLGEFHKMMSRCHAQHMYLLTTLIINTTNVRESQILRELEAMNKRWEEEDSE